MACYTCKTLIPGAAPEMRRMYWKMLDGQCDKCGDWL